MIRDRDRLLEQLRRLHNAIQRAVVAATERAQPGALASVVADDAGGDDTIYALDRVSEAYLVDWFAREVAPERPLLLVAEGLPDRGDGPGMLALPRGVHTDAAEVRILMDPIDGTRGLMFQKRSAWILTGVAPNCGPQTSLRDIELAVQTEIPLVKQHLADSLWAARGEGFSAERYNRLTGERAPLALQPDTTTTIAHHFATVARFVPGARGALAAIDEEVMEAALGPVEPGKARSFEDQYISSGGQLYGLIAGQDAFVADLRPLIEPLLAREGRALGLACHPYDLATALIAEEAGVLLSDGYGKPLDAPLDTQTNVAWVGYANAAIRAEVEPGLLAALDRRGLL
ncbi:MAG TPA: inositol monophosphatase [Ktedonobacterales bacterium]|nr:inositol monophosphatase [Ktedonobacterales bacterium]